MLVTLNSQFQSDLCPIPASFTEIPDSHADNYLRLPLYQQYTWVGLRILSSVRGQGERTSDS